MITKNQAMEILEKIKNNRPNKFFNKLDDTEAGMRFVLIYSYIHFNGGCFGFMNFFLRSLYTRLALFASHIHYMNPFFFL